MKKLLCLFLTLLLLFTACSGLTVHADGSLSANASAGSVTVGNSVTVTLAYNGGGAPIGALTTQLQYNAAAFEYVSCSGASASGGAGVVKAIYYADAAQAPQTVTVTMTFKAIAAGNGDFAVSTGEFINDNDYTSLGSPSATVSVSAMNPTQSANANLSRIKPSSGTLTPAFKPSVTKYTIAVPYTTTSLSLSVSTQDKGARTSISGKNALVVGDNTQVITVTAPNGATKKYTVVITRAGQSDVSTDPSGPAVDTLDVEVGGVLMTVTDTQPSVELPQGFEWSTATINNLTVSAAVNQTLNLTLVYLTNPTDQTSAFYIYNTEADKFYPFCPLAVAGGSYILLEMPADQAAPTGTVAGKKTFGSIERDVFLFEDTALGDIALVYASSPAGKTALYIYDETDGSMQLYRAISLPADTKPEPAPEPTGNVFTRFITQYRVHILICAAAAGSLALLITAIILLIFFIRRDRTKGKH